MYFPLFLFRYEPTAKSSCSFKAGSRFVECQHMLQEYTIPAPAPVTSVRSTSAARQFLHPTVKEGVIRFLVTTNDHLLKELDVTRERQ
ncbi:hypothetical protein DPMN_090435 [Dreissena polymorpha]|uniref:Uncharacterized protein n=1 Tax=Dreissena polymorpha TaxID=45954 RepID=A0A9D4QZ20_DREPO|nr:hypothetical protein DPMN_090435 [Dreissena polymorpha]